MRYLGNANADKGMYADAGIWFIYIYIYIFKLGRPFSSERVPLVGSMIVDGRKDMGLSFFHFSCFVFKGNQEDNMLLCFL